MTDFNIKKIIHLNLSTSKGQTVATVTWKPTEGRIGHIIEYPFEENFKLEDLAQFAIEGKLSSRYLNFNIFPFNNLTLENKIQALRMFGGLS